MEKNSNSIFAGIKAGLLFLGTIIGAGFASGKEILTFFTGNAVTLVFAVIIAGIFFYLTGLLFFNLGKRIKANNIFKVTEILLKKYSFVFNMFLVFCYLIILSAMLAGVDVLAKESLGYKGIIPIFSIILLILALLSVKKGITSLLKINSLLVPIIIIFIIVVCFFSLNQTNSTVSDNIANKEITFFSSIINSVLYVAMNMLLSSAILITAGNNMDKTQIKISAFLAALIITVLLTVILLACRLNYSQIQGMEMPIIVFALRISPLFSIISIIILSFAIFTTLISSMYPLKDFLQFYIKKENKLYITLALTAFILSRIGFSYIITYIYPLMGIIGIMFIAFCAIYNIQSTILPIKFKKIKKQFN